MSDSTEATATLPPGDKDPNLLYIAVGKSIHRWEGLEQALARLYLKYSNVPETPESYHSFGKENGTFKQRMAALEAAAAAYANTSHDQATEGEFLEILTRTRDLSIERHRIAHGHITMWGEAEIPKNEGPFEVTMKFLYRWAPPFYGVLKLRTNPVGHNAATIDAISERFEQLHNQVAAFTEKI